MTLTVKLFLIAALMLKHYHPIRILSDWGKDEKKYKRAIGANAFFFFGAFVIASIMMFAGDPVKAADTAAAASCFFVYRTRLSCCCSVYRFFLCRWWYSRCKRSLRCFRRYQRRFKCAR